MNTQNGSQTTGCTTQPFATSTKNGSSLTINIQACTNKITSGEDAGQCDSDLENLMSIVNKDLNNAIGENQELVKKIAETVKQ